MVHWKLGSAEDKVKQMLVLSPNLQLIELFDTHLNLFSLLQLNEY